MIVEGRGKMKKEERRRRKEEGGRWRAKIERRRVEGREKRIK